MKKKTELELHQKISGVDKSNCSKKKNSSHIERPNGKEPQHDFNSSSCSRTLTTTNTLNDYFLWEEDIDFFKRKSSNYKEQLELTFLYCWVLLDVGSKKILLSLYASKPISFYNQIRKETRLSIVSLTTYKDSA